MVFLHDFYEESILRKMLQQNKDDLSPFSLDYLKCLIDLEFSAIKPYISEKERSALVHSDLYKRVICFNLYNRALYLFDHNNIPVTIKGNEMTFSAYSYTTKKPVKLFEFYHGGHSPYYFYSEYTHINIYEYIGSITTKDEILAYLAGVIEQLHSETNPYPRLMTYTYAKWEEVHIQLLENYEKTYCEVMHKLPTYDEFSLAGMTNDISELFLREYGLDESDFEIESQKNLTDDYHINQVLVKKCLLWKFVDT